MATINEIKQQAEAVKNATQVGENTAMRVGGALAGLADIAKEQEDNIGKKANKADMDAELAKKANTADVASKFTEEKKRVDAELDKKANAVDVASKFTAEAARVNTELEKKFDKSSIAQESGEAEDKVMSQKATTTAITDETTRATAAEQANAQAITDNENIVIAISRNMADSGNLLEYWYKREKYVQALRVIKEKNVYAKSKVAGLELPSQFYGARYFAFDEPIVNNTGVQIISTLANFYIRKLSNINFSTWLFIDKKNYITDITLRLKILKQYPSGSYISRYTYKFKSSTNFSDAKQNPITVTVSDDGNKSGDLNVIIDDFIPQDSGFFIHFKFEKDIMVDYAYFNIKLDDSYVGNGVTYETGKKVVNPVIRTSDEDYTFDEVTDKNYLMTPMLIHNGLTMQGSLGHVTQKSNAFRYMEIKKERDDVEYSFSNDNERVNMLVKSENNIVTDSSVVNNLLSIVSSDWLPQEIYDKKVMYFQYKVKFDDVVNLFAISSNPLTNNLVIEESFITVQGLNTNSISNTDKTKKVIDFSEDGFITIRNVYYIDGKSRSLGVGFIFRQNGYVQKEITIYDMVLSAQPPLLNAPRKPNDNPVTRGKSFMIFGDSEFNWGSQYKLPVERLGMKAIVGAMGAHMMAYNPSYKTGGGIGEGHGWLYAWEYRNEVFQVPADYYIFCVSTNDNGAGGKNYEYQSVEDEDVQYVLDNYPSYGDTEEEAAAKMANFLNMDDSVLIQKFNLSSVYCAYIEQIFEYNPKARIILANSPITCTGLLTGSAGTDGRGIWKEGKNPRTARLQYKPVFDRLSQIMRNVADKYNLPVIDFYHNTGLTFENFTQYCIDGTHWTDIVNNDKLKGINYIAEREGELIIKHLLEHKN